MQAGDSIQGEAGSMPEGYGRVGRIKIYVREHLNGNLGTQAVADVFEISVSTLHHLFKDETGQNFQRFVESARMQTAFELLTTKGRIIKEVMYLTGYTIRSTFNRAFKRHFKKPPGFFIK